MKRFLIIATLLLTSACSPEAAPAEPVPPPAPEPVAAAEPPPAVVAAPEPDPTAEELPIEADFEAEVATQITAKNFKGELTRLEAEIASDTAE